MGSTGDKTRMMFKYSGKIGWVRRAGGALKIWFCPVVAAAGRSADMVEQTTGLEAMFNSHLVYIPAC